MTQLEDPCVHPPHPPRARTHIGLIRWTRAGDGEWSPETIRGQFVSGDGRRWWVRLYDGTEMEYDLDQWAPFQP